jgi:hypothetical protein
MEPIVVWVFWGCILLIMGAVLYEVLPRNSRLIEGFQTTLADSKFWMRLAPRRGDVGPELEESGLVRDDRYFKGYADVQRFGTKLDFCRIVQQGDDEENKFMACALGGTENLSSTSFRSPNVRDGFVLSRDDYFHDINGDGSEDYCRIVKQPSGDFRAECNLATSTGFEQAMRPDNKPPKEIEQLLRFYNGVVFWLRLRDDMLDYAKNLYVNTVGDAEVDETVPNPTVTEGLVLDGKSQYLRIGDDDYLNFGSTVLLRQVRAWHMWVRFDEFTNNAHIFDFGNGAGIDNVWIGILNRGNQGLQPPPKPLLCGGEDTIPEPPSGPQPVEEVSPQVLMKTTDANVEEFTCEGFAVAPRKMPRTIPKAVKNPALAQTADLCYEIWDKDQRKMRIVVPQAVKRGEWMHLVITAISSESFRPDIEFYINGKRRYVEPSGWLPQNSITEKNYIAKSNWADDTSQYANKDELFCGALFDFRAYNRPFTGKVIQESYEWGKKLLGL